MNTSHSRTLMIIAAAAVLAAGCAKKKVATAPPPPPPSSTTQTTTARTTTPPARAAVTQRPTATTPAVRYPSPATRARIDQLLARIEDAYFDYDKANLRPDALKALQADSSELRDILKDFPDYKLTIQGYADERGSAEYNLALGEKRAESAKDYLVQVGIPAAQFNVVSYGKEKPVCTEHDEGCWQRNRRIHIVAMATPTH